MPRKPVKTIRLQRERDAPARRFQSPPTPPAEEESLIKASKW